MTTLQVRIGDHLVTVNADALNFKASGIFKLTGEGDLIILEPLENAGSASDPYNAEEAEATIQAQAQTIQDLGERSEAQDQTIQALRRYAEDLRGDLANARSTIEQRTQDKRRAEALLVDATDAGENIWNNTVQSDRDPQTKYRVSLYRMRNGQIRGVCQCMDFHLHGAGPRNTLYKCKHIQRQIREASVFPRAS